MAAVRSERARRGESIAAQHLEAAGYSILERNVRIGHDEADLVGLAPNGAIAIVEVKTRMGRWHGEERVDSAKRRNLLRLAAALSQRGPYRRRLFQFDVVAVQLDSHGGGTALHFPHAFDASGSGW